MSKSLPKSIIVAILAGGKARRFDSQDKGSLLIHDDRLIDIIYNRLKPQSDEILISGTHDYDLNLQIIPDKDEAPGGPVGGIYSIWSALQSRGDIEGFFTVAVDGPNLADNFTAKLYYETCSAIAIDRAGRHPTYGWWRMADLAQVFANINLQSSISLNGLADEVLAKEVHWAGDNKFININSQKDLNNYVKGG